MSLPPDKSDTQTDTRIVSDAVSHPDRSAAEIEFANAMRDYQHRSGRMFPTWSEVLEVLAALGYQKLPHAPNSKSKR